MTQELGAPSCHLQCRILAHLGCPYNVRSFAVQAQMLVRCFGTPGDVNLHSNTWVFTVDRETTCTQPLLTNDMFLWPFAEQCTGPILQVLFKHPFWNGINLGDVPFWYMCIEPPKPPVLIVRGTCTTETVTAKPCAVPRPLSRGSLLSTGTEWPSSIQALIQEYLAAKPCAARHRTFLGLKVGDPQPQKACLLSYLLTCPAVLLFHSQTHCVFRHEAYMTHIFTLRRAVREQVRSKLETAHCSAVAAVGHTFVGGASCHFGHDTGTAQKGLKMSQRPKVVALLSATSFVFGQPVSTRPLLCRGCFWEFCYFFSLSKQLACSHLQPLAPCRPSYIFFHLDIQCSEKGVSAHLAAVSADTFN